MVSTFTTNKGFERPANGDYIDTWDVPVNLDWTEIDTAFGGSTLLNATGLSGDQALAVASYRPLSLLISGTPIAATTYVIPSGVGGQWVFLNGTTGGFTIGIKSAAGGSTITVAAGLSALVSCDGSASGMRRSITEVPAAAGSSTQVQYNSSGLLAGAAGLTYAAATGDVTVGTTATSILTLTGTPVAVPNNLNIDTDTLFVDATNNRVGVGTTAPSSKLTVAGQIETTLTGVKYPDGSVQSTAYLVTTQQVVAVTEVDFTGLTGNNLEISFNLGMSAPGLILGVRYYISGVLDTGANYYIQSMSIVNGGTPAGAIGGSLTSFSLGAFGNTIPVSGKLFFQDVQTTSRVQGEGFVTGVDATNTVLVGEVVFGGHFAPGGPVTGIRFFCTAAMTGRVTLRQC